MCMHILVSYRHAFLILIELLPVTPIARPGAATPTSAVISWNQQSKVDSYEISFERATGDQQLGDCPAYEHSGRVPALAGTTTTYTLTGLQEFSTYFITVTAVNVAGRSENATVNVTTATAGMLMSAILKVLILRNFLGNYMQVRCYKAKFSTN